MSREKKQKNGKRAVKALSLNQGFCVKLLRSTARQKKKLENAVHTQEGNFNILGLTQ